jgi:hypothetical protein
MGLAGRYLAPRRRVSISMMMKPAARIAAFKFSVSAKSAAALRNSKKVLIGCPILQVAVRRFLALDGIKKGPGQTPQATFLDRPRRWHIARQRGIPWNGGATVMVFDAHHSTQRNSEASGDRR